VLILDTGFEIILWQGQKTKSIEKNICTEAAKVYMSKFQRPENIKISYCYEGAESHLFLFFLN